MNYRSFESFKQAVTQERGYPDIRYIRPSSIKYLKEQIDKSKMSADHKKSAHNILKMYTKDFKFIDTKIYNNIVDVIKSFSIYDREEKIRKINNQIKKDDIETKKLNNKVALLNATKQLQKNIDDDVDILRRYRYIVPKEKRKDLGFSKKVLEQVEQEIESNRFQGLVKEYRLPVLYGRNNYQNGSYIDELRDQARKLKKILQSRISLGPFRFKVVYFAMMKNEGGKIKSAVFWGHNEKATDSIKKIKTILRKADINKAVDDYKNNIIEKIEKYTVEKSGWVWLHSISFEFFIMKYDIRGGSSYIPLPKWTRRCTVNVQNQDQKCFLWSILAWKHQRQNHAERVNYYKQFENEINMTGINYPVEEKDWKKIEKQNDFGICVHHIRSKTQDASPLYITKKNTPNVCHIGLYQKDDKSHYVWIRSIGALIKPNQGKHGYFMCPKCYHNFRTEKFLLDHIPHCNHIGRTTLPEPGKNILKFEKTMNSIKSPFIVFADFECSIDDEQNHKPNSYCFLVVDFNKVFYDSGYMLRQYRGDDCMEDFLTEISEECEKLTSFVKTTDEPIRMTEEDKLKHELATKCYMCNRDFVEGDKKIREHCHLTGKYRGAAHDKCNSKEKRNHWQVPVVFHNLRGYDSHFIIQYINKLGESELKKLNVIANSMEKFMTFSTANMKFIDSFQHISCSLDQLVQNLKKSGINSFGYTSKFFNGQKLDLITQKGVYPYDMVKNSEIFGRTDLFTKEEFFNKLNNCGISDKDYNRYLTVYEKFGCKNFGDYHDLYLKSDVLLLADVFIKYMNVIYDNYVLDPAHYITMASLAWDCMLKHTKCDVELITDIDLYLFFEQNIRGGMCFTPNRYAKANNKYLSDFDDTIASSFITYLDANALYAHCMTEYLPLRNIKWDHDIPKMTKEELKPFIMNYHNNHPLTDGLVLEVKLTYPSDLHDLHNDLPLAVENTTFELSKFMKEHATKFDINCAKTKKLIPNLNNKDKYVVHLKTLQLYLSKGLELECVYRAVTFHQEPWMKPYIDNNARMRKDAVDDYEKDLWKMMSNAVYGKTMENVRKRAEVKIVTGNNMRRAQKLLNSPLLRQVQILKQDEIIAVQKAQKEIVLCKPIFVGFSVLELSKYIMYNFHYNFIKSKYSDKAKLLYTDTDSLIYHIETKDLYQDMKDNQEYFDFSKIGKNPQLEHFYDDDTKKNTNVYGKFKDDVGYPMSEFVSLRPKMYSYTYEENEALKNKMRAKGVKKSSLSDIHHENYKNCLFNNDVNFKDYTVQRVQFMQIKSVNHKVSTISQDKISLCNFDDKRYWLDNVNSYAFGHKNI